MFLYEYELGRAADILTRGLFKLKPDETFVITADIESDLRVVNATARAAFAVGAKPMVILLASPLGVSEAADPMLPVESLTGALKGADAWLDGVQLLDEGKVVYPELVELAQKLGKG